MGADVTSSVAVALRKERAAAAGILKSRVYGTGI